MSNKVIRGTYSGHDIISVLGKTQIQLSFFGGKTVYLDKYNVKRYEIVNKNKKIDKESMAWRGLIGGLVGGLKGTTYGASRARHRYEYDVHIIFVTGAESMAHMDDKVFNDFKENMVMPWRDPTVTKDVLSAK